MSYQPSDFFIGVVDVFAVLLPGAVLTAFVAPLGAPYLFGPVLPVLEGDLPRWAAFLVSAYILGHLAYLAGSPLDALYDRYRRRKHPIDRDRAYLLATRLKEDVLGPDDREVINTFRWSKETLQLRHPGAAAQIHRLEADSKFFRTFMVVLAIVAALLAVRGEVAYGLIALVLILPSFRRYADQRWKSTQLAYEYLIVLYRSPPAESSGDS